MRKITILSNSILGLYSFRRELIIRLIDEGFDISIVAPDGEKKDYFTNLGCHFREVRISRRGINPVSDAMLFIKYLRDIKKTTPDVVLTYTIKPNVYGGLACSLFGVPYISNITGLGSAMENRKLLQRVVMLLYKISLKKSRCVFFQNKENQQFFLEKNLVGPKHKLIPGSGVNLDHFQLMEYPNDDILHFLFIGRIMKEKGIDQYLEAAEMIKKKQPNTVFHVLGACEENYERILKEREIKGIIKYHGRQSDVRKYHKISHCTIHPSYYPEGMSNVLLESAACGRPVITTNRSGCKETVLDGITGFIFEKRNSSDLIEKITKFIQMPYHEKKKMGLLGRKKVELEFDRRIVIQNYMDEINKALYR